MVAAASMTIVAMAVAVVESAAAAVVAADVVTLMTMAVTEGTAAAMAVEAVVTLVPMAVAGPHSGEGGPDPDDRGPRPSAWTETQPAGLERVGGSGGASERDITAAARSPWLLHVERRAAAEGGGPPWGPRASASSPLFRSTALLSQGDGVPLADARSPDSHASARSRTAASRLRANGARRAPARRRWPPLTPQTAMLRRPRRRVHGGTAPAPDSGTHQRPSRRRGTFGERRAHRNSPRRRRRPTPRRRAPRPQRGPGPQQSRLAPQRRLRAERRSTEWASNEAEARLLRR